MGPVLAHRPLELLLPLRSDVLLQIDLLRRVPRSVAVVRLRRPMMSLPQLSNCLTLESSFSSVSTATIASNDAFCSIFRDLQDLHSSRGLNFQDQFFSDLNFEKLCQNFAEK